MVFKSMRGSLSITAPTSASSISTRCVAQDHPAYIPRRSRAATDHRPGTRRNACAARPPRFKPSVPRYRRTPCRSRACRCARSYCRCIRDRAPGRHRRMPCSDHCCSWPLLAPWPPTWWPSPDRRRSPPGAGAVKGLVPKGLPRCFGRAEAHRTRGCTTTKGGGQRILEPLTAAVEG
jgi:hypothetical protein